jgi:hypothetical protein
MRPDIEEIYIGDFDKAGAGIGCPCGAFIYSNEQLQDHWEAGHFDKPDAPPPLGVHVSDGVGSGDKVGG